MGQGVEIKGIAEVHNLARALDLLAQRQIPFAVAKTLTMAGNEVRNLSRQRLARRFELRSQRVKSSVTVGPKARKEDWPRSSVTIGVRDEWLARHEEGGTQRPKGARNFAVPLRIVASQRTKGGKLPASLRPSPLIQKKKARVSDGEVVTLGRPIGRLRGKGVKRRRLFFLRSTIRLEPKLGLRADADEVMGARGFFARQFPFELKRALATARP